MAKIVRKRVYLSNGAKRNRKLFRTLLSTLPVPPPAQAPNVDFYKLPGRSKNPQKAAKIRRGAKRKQRQLLRGLYLNARPSTVVLPNVQGILLPSAQSVLTNAGLGFQVQYTPSLVYPFNTVIFQTPIPGVSVAVGTIIKLLVSSGAATVPQEIGRQIALAVADVVALGLLPQVTFRASLTAVPGVVLDQTPRVGAKVLIGSPIFFTVAALPPPGAARAQLPSTGDIVRVITSTN